MAKILAREATIRTVSVEIKGLTVSGRQVTLALFRQLQEQRLIDHETLQMVGVPWGRVNYHTKECEGDGEHMHVVWQDGEELRRCSVERGQGKQIAGYYERDAQERLRSALVRLAKGEIGQVEDHSWNEKVLVLGGRCVALRSEIGTAIRFYWGRLEGDRLAEGRYQEHVRRPPSNEERARRTHGYESERLDRRRKNPEAPDAWQKVISLCAEHLGEDWDQRSIEKCIADCQSLMRQSGWAANRWAELYMALGDLDQLFIAV